jgi:excisionase family DNA binding protein
MADEILTRYNPDFLTITELAKIMNLSRVQIFRKIKAGQIPAQRVGNIFLIPKDFADSFSGEMTAKDEKTIESGVKKIFKEYGSVIKKLGNK